MKPSLSATLSKPVSFSKAPMLLAPPCIASTSGAGLLSLGGTCRRYSRWPGVPTSILSLWVPGEVGIPSTVFLGPEVGAEVGEPWHPATRVRARTEATETIQIRRIGPNLTDG